MAGRIGAEALNYGRSLIKEGASLVEIADKVEAKIVQLGGGIAFPVQISRNHLAAHYCPDIEDRTVLEAGDVVKIDLGVSIDGFLSDTACTLYLGEDPDIQNLVEASRSALQNVSKIIKSGVEIGTLGSEIQRTITSMGFSPIRNLSGHGLGRFQVHAAPTIPNFSVSSKNVLGVQAVAVEPFATTGVGIVENSGIPNVFLLNVKRPVRDRIVRKVLSAISGYNGLPFARRWLERLFPKAEVNYALRQLVRDELITEYPPLGEISGGLVSQAEHTFLLLRDRTIISTERA
jgi:methionyl aminopeptidase